MNSFPTGPRDGRGRRTGGIARLMLVLCLVLVSFLAPAILAGCLENISSTTSTPFVLQDLVVPRVPDYAPHADETVPTTVSFPPATGINFTVSYTNAIPVYVNWTSSWDIEIKNSAAAPMYVFRITMNASWNSSGFELVVNRKIESGETRDMGTIGITGPNVAGDVTYHFAVEFAMLNSGLTWSKAPEYTTTSRTLTIHQPEELRTIDRISNFDQYYNRINSIVDPYNETVYIKTRNLVSSHPGTYNIYQVLEIFDWVRDNITYVSDPVNRDQWQTPGVILAAAAGDCDDFSILFSTMVLSIGGTVRMHLTDSHAYCSVFAGNLSDLGNVTNAIRAFYRSPVPVTWYADKWGYWVNADPTSSLSMGSLPYHAVPTVTAPLNSEASLPAQEAWAFDQNTTTLISIDVKPQEQ